VAAQTPDETSAPDASLVGRLRSHWAHAQHRNAYYLLLNGISGAATGLLFWLIFARLVHLPAADIGVGYAIVALGTTIGLVAKGGLDTALVRMVPGASHREGVRLLWLAILIGSVVALVLSAGLALLSYLGSFAATARSWVLVAAIAIFLVVTWLQDAYFLAEGEARLSFQRNIVFSAARLLLPILVLAIALPRPVALTWALSLMVSAAAASVFVHRRPHRDGSTIARREFLRSAARNISGSAAEFLPGLLLTPLVLAINGPEAAAYFGIAWTAASLLFLASSAICRSALAEMVRNKGHEAHAIRRAVRQHWWTVVPGAILGALLAPFVLAIFGNAYSANGAPVMVILCASSLVVAPVYLYLAYLRAHEKPVALVLFPAAMVGALFLLAPLLEQRIGLRGVAIAWLLANAPFGLYAAWKLRLAAREVTPHANAPSLGGAPHLE
jgi:O-antigen/teichoic acid export membrane protein